MDGAAGTTAPPDLTCPCVCVVLAMPCHAMPCVCVRVYSVFRARLRMLMCLIRQPAVLTTGVRCGAPVTLTLATVRVLGRLPWALRRPCRCNPHRCRVLACGRAVLLLAAAWVMQRAARAPHHPHPCNRWPALAHSSRGCSLKVWTKAVSQCCSVAVLQCRSVALVGWLVCPHASAVAWCAPR